MPTLIVGVPASGEVGRAVVAAPAPVALRLLGSYVSGLGEGASETVAYERGRVYVTDAASNTLDWP